MKLHIAIGDVLRTNRIKQNKTLRDLTGYIALGHLSDVERGRKTMSPELLEEVIYQLHMTTPEFLRQVADTMEG